MTHFKYQVHIVAIFKIVIKLKKKKQSKEIRIVADYTASHICSYC